jgi:hypothetical protein
MPEEGAPIPNDQAKIVLADGENIIVDVSPEFVVAELGQGTRDPGGSAFVRFRRVSGTVIFIAADKVLFVEPV